VVKYDNIIGKRLLEVNEKPEQLTLIFEDGEYLIVYVKNGKLYIESSDTETNKHYLGLFAGAFLIIFGLIGSIYFLTNPEDFSEGYHLFMSRMFALLLLAGIFTFIFSIKSILDKYMKHRSLTSNKDNNLSPW
jgi:hypothetical protein